MTEAAANNPKLAQNCVVLYGIFAVSMVLALLPVPLAMGLSTLLMLGGIVMAYIWRGKAGEGVLETHFHWLIRTFWIGGAVYLPVLTVFACIAVISVVDMTELHDAIRTAALENTPTSPSEDQSIVINTVLKTVWDKHGGVIMAITGTVTLPFVGWWFWRCFKGFRLLKAGKPVENVMRWL